MPRNLLPLCTLLILALAAASAATESVTLPPAATAVAHAPEGGATPGAALEQLLAGNARYVEGKPTHQNQDAARRTATATSQKPFAVIVSCSDSRVPPEILFDAGIGDLFIIRSAGHVVDDVALGSIEYALEHCGTTLVVVLGHERCGAVAAVVKGGEMPGHIPSLVRAISPAVEMMRSKPGDLAENAMRSNVGLTVYQLKSSKPVIEEMVKAERVKIVGARYDLDDGKVEIIK